MVTSLFSVLICFRNELLSPSDAVAAARASARSVMSEGTPPLAATA